MQGMELEVRGHHARLVHCGRGCRAGACREGGCCCCLCGGNAISEMVCTSDPEGIKHGLYTAERGAGQVPAEKVCASVEAQINWSVTVCFPGTVVPKAC